MITESFNLSKPMIALLEKHGITDATPIQKEIIPAINEGRDVIAQSETGSGKTISFAVPIIEKINKTDGLVSLILVPTRELCIQITDEFSKFSKNKKLGILSVYGGVSIENQIKKIKKTNIIIATPGRLIDLLDRGSIKFDKIKFLVFDEADRMLDMGFITDIEKIMEDLPEKRQTMLFSATVSKEIVRLSRKYLNDPVHVSFQSEIAPEFLRQIYYKISTEKKLPLLLHLLRKERDLVLVFCNRKHITDKLSKKLREHGINAKCLHGDMTQGQRERVTMEFRQKKINVLIATDVAARGLHIEDISHVYNYEIPRDVDSYTHRIGRTARAGNKGEAISIVSGGEDQKFFKLILFAFGDNITLKSINPDVLPVIVQKHPEQKKKHKVQLQPSNIPPLLMKENSYERKHQHSRNERKPRTFGDRNKKIWNEWKPNSFSEGKTNPWDEKQPKHSSTSKVNSKPWEKKKKKTFGGNSAKPWGGNSAKPWGGNSAKPWSGDSAKPWSGKKKSKGGKKRKNKTEQESVPWEVRKPKFWTEKKSKTRRDSLDKM
jgi:ATP-dependent RNA helicase DeaD